MIGIFCPQKKRIIEFVCICLLQSTWTVFCWLWHQTNLYKQETFLFEKHICCSLFDDNSFQSSVQNDCQFSQYPKWIKTLTFCQKLLVYENESGEVWIAYNDIVAFANLYYQTSTKPQQMINQRLKMTFSKAITLQVEE